MLEREKIIFHPISLADRDWINDKLKVDDLMACEYTFANNYMWAKVYDVQVGEVYGCGVIRYRENENFEYSFPFGDGDKKAVIELLRGICHAHGHELNLYPIDDVGRRRLIEWFSGEFEIDADRSDFDYVYTVEKLSTLRGKKLHGKRNHIARFMDDNDWRYEKMTSDNIGECRKMAREWIAMREEKWNEDMQEEMDVLAIAFDNFNELGFVGGVIYKQEKIVAFTIGERLNSNTFVVHFEKAYPDLQGAYPMINQQFILHEGQDYTYVNREEDTGDLGLRKAKLSYYPDILLKKYMAKESHVVFANEYDRENIIDIWEKCFGDERDYIKMYLDNRFEIENMFVIHEDGRPVSMASFLPVNIFIKGEYVSARYVYAVATLPQYRNKGYASEILKYASQKYNEPLILQPENDELVKYYEKIGFVTGFKDSPCWVYEHRACELMAAQYSENEFAGENITPERYKEIRDRYFENEGYVQWDENALKYAIRENEYCDGKTLLINGSDIMMYRIEEGDRLHVIETTLDDNELSKLLPCFMDTLGVRYAYSRNHGGMILFPQNAQIIGFEEGYLGLTLG
jgi:hypothetical protein